MATILLAVLVIPALVTADAVMRRSPMAAAFTAAILVPVLALITWIYPTDIQDDAKSIAAGRPYCLAVPREHRPVQQWLDITVLHARGDWLRQHLVLSVQGSDEVEDFHWSYIKRRFVPGLQGMWHCAPRERFLDTLREEKPGFFVWLDGSAYIIPPERNPQHQEDDYLSFNFGFNTAASALGGNVEIGTTAVEKWEKRMLDDAVGLSGVNETVRRKGDFGYTDYSFDGDGRLIEKVGCVIEQRRCVLEMIKPPGVFWVPFDQDTRNGIDKVKSGVDRIWQSFKVSE